MKQDSQGKFPETGSVQEEEYFLFLLQSHLRTSTKKIIPQIRKVYLKSCKIKVPHGLNEVFLIFKFFNWMPYRLFRGISLLGRFKTVLNRLVPLVLQ